MAVIKARKDISSPVSRRSGHPWFPLTTVPQTEEDQDGVQPQSAAKAGTRFRKESLRSWRRKEAAGAVAEFDRNTGQSMVSKSSDETQTDAAGGGGEGPAAGGSSQQELAPRQQMEAGDGATAAAEPIVRSVSATASAAATVAATATATAGIPTAPVAEAHAGTERWMFVRFGNLRDTKNKKCVKHKL